MSKKHREVKYVKLSITMPEDVATEIRESTDNISAFISQASQEYLSRRKFLEGVRTARGAWPDEDYPDLTNSEDILVWLEELRKGSGAAEGRTDASRSQD